MLTLHAKTTGKVFGRTLRCPRAKKSCVTSAINTVRKNLYCLAKNIAKNTPDEILESLPTENV